MLVQQRAAGGLRLIGQHEHALLCGSMGQRWRGLSAEAERLPFASVLAMGLHDYAWRAVDARPRLNGETGRPYDFLDFPTGERLALYRSGVDALEELHPYVAFLVSWHYATFAQMVRHTDYQEGESVRRGRLAERLPAAQRDPDRQRRDLDLLKFFDALSLFICLAPPGARPGGVPSWLAPAAFAKLPGGPHLELAWEGEGRLLVDPYPWEAPLSLAVPVRDTRDARFADQAALEAALAEAEVGVWEVRLCPSEG